MSVISLSILRKATVVAVLLCAALSFVPREASAQQAPVAIVVHPGVKTSSITFKDLQRIFKAEQQFWPDGSRITLLVRAPVAAERSVILNKIYKMSEDQFRQFWIAKMFRADVAAGPKIVYSTESARDLVFAIPGAITFLPLSAVTPDVKVLRIDGALPADGTYPLKGR